MGRRPWRTAGEPSAAGEAAEGADAETQELENLELGDGNGGAEDMDAEDETEALSRREPPHRG